MDVGVRELKKHLSEYLDRAARGELVRVTDRGRPKAILGPLPVPQRDLGVEQGWIRAGRRQIPKAIPRQPSEHSVMDVLSKDRGR